MFYLCLRILHHFTLFGEALNACMIPSNTEQMVVLLFVEQTRWRGCVVLVWSNVLSFMLLTERRLVRCCDGFRHRCTRLLNLLVKTCHHIVKCFADARSYKVTRFF